MAENIKASALKNQPNSAGELKTFIAFLNALGRLDYVAQGEARLVCTCALAAIPSGAKDAQL